MRARSDSDTESNCQNCGKELFGRTDKRFCNDSCRNEFNRRKKQQEAVAANEAIPEILRIIKRNYEILLNIGPLEPDTEIYFQLPNPRLKEFDFRFYTSVKDYGHLRYYFCFERGWRKDEDIFYVKEDLQQAKI